MKRKLLLLFAILFSMLMVKAQITATFNYSGSIVNWTVPSGIYSVTINAMGASGGNNTAYANNGGRGANMQGTFTVTPGDVLKILVGQAGTASSAPSGGGGSFVATSSNTPLIVAGGGGGAGYSSDYSQATADAPATTSGNGGYDPDRTTESGTGGTGGYGGNPGRLTPGGGGFYGDGVYSASDGSNSVAGLGKSFLNGGAGGASSPTAACFTWVSSPGGFGGGGGAGYAAAGAGGGYSGGGGTSGCNPGTGGGGGSYNSGTSQTNIGGYNYGNGLVTITYASPQIITFNALPAKTYGNTPFTVSATGGASGNPVVFTSSDPTIATCTGTNGTTVTILKAGTVNIIANQAGGGTYAAANPTPQSLVINPITLTVTGATASNKVYDGTTTATISGGTLVGIINSDVVSLATATSGTFSSSAVGTGKTVTSTMTLTGANAGNYTVAQPALTANITAKTLTVTGASGVNKVYNGTTAATITGGTLAGVVGSDAVTLATATSGTFASANVGTGIGITSAMTLTGAAAGNYTLTQPALAANITAKNLTVSGALGVNKVYDGTTAATITGGTLSGIVGSDAVTLATATSGVFASANVGTGISITSAMTLTGAAAGNYTITQPTLTANITAKTLIVSGAAGVNKVYNGTTAATITGGTLAGVVGSDAVTLATATSGTFASANVGTGISITSAMTLTGAAAGNYTITQPTLTANITPKTLSVSGASGVNKVYNGTTAATITGGSLAGVVGSDAVTLATATSGTFASANVGTGISITSAMTLTGAAAGNYTLTQPVLSADITPLALTVSGTTAKNKVYNGNVIDTITGATLTGVLNDDIVILNGDTIGTFTQSTVGTNILVTTDMWLSGLNAENYSLPVQPTINANITPLALTISSATANSKTYDGTDTTTIYGVVLSGIVGDDDVTLTGDTVGTFPGPDAGTNLTVTTNINLAGPAAGNYVLAGQPLLFANIDPLPVTVSGAVASNKVYDGNSIDTLKGATLTGILEGDIVTLTGDTLGSFESPNAGKNIQVIVRMGLSGPDAGNYSISQPALSADITPLNITVTGAFATNKVYDGTATDTIWGGTLVGVIDPDIVNLPDSSLGTFANVNVGTGITVTSDIILAGAQAGNYTLAQPSLSADITPLPLSIVAKAENKVYDGTTTDTITGSTLSGIVGSDDVKLTADTLGTFASSNAGTKITVTSNMNLTGAAAGNYSLTQPALSADITPLSLTVTGATAENKVYDGTSTDTIHDGTLTGVIGSDVVTVPPSSTGSFASLNVGTGIVVTSDILLSGSSAGNYTLIQPVLSANITQRPITITANAVSKMKGINDPALTYSITAGNLVGSDEFTGSLTRQPGDTVGKYNIELGTLSAGPDYDITFVPAIFTIEVNTGVLTISDTKPVLYPNPARDYIYIDNLPENTSIFIFNLTGKLIKDNIATSTTGKIDINDIPSGVYIIKLSGTQINTVIRFVKL